MGLSRISLLALSIVVLGTTVPASVHAQQTDKPFDFKPLLPPIVPVPPNSAVTSGSVERRAEPPTPPHRCKVRRNHRRSPPRACG